MARRSDPNKHSSEMNYREVLIRSRANKINDLAGQIAADSRLTDYQMSQLFKIGELADSIVDLAEKTEDAQGATIAKDELPKLAAAKDEKADE